jgi:hypothetical protein
MIDVFMRTTRNLNPLRRGFLEATIARWCMHPLVQLHSFVDYEIRRARRQAEKDAQSDPYIFTDDDVVIVGKNWIERGVEAMLANPEYAVCSSLSLIEGENQAVAPPGAGAIYPMHWVGAPMWIRKNILTDLPEMTLNNECEMIHNYVLAKGKKEGLITGLRHCHMGHGFSSTPGLDFGY